MIEFKRKHVMNIIFNHVGSIQPLKLYKDEKRKIKNCFR